MFAHVRPAGTPTVLAQNSFNTRPVRSTVVPTAQSRKKMLQLAHSLKGKPYVWGATGPDRFDCSGFVYYVISNEVGPGHYREKEIKARTYKRILDAAGARIQDIFQARAGDIVFFPSNVNKGYRTDHIGFVIDPARGIFVTAQNPEIGVGLGSYAVGQYWASREPMIYRNIWVP